jgi:hypothetical protein
MGYLIITNMLGLLARTLDTTWPQHYVLTKLGYQGPRFYATLVFNYVQNVSIDFYYVHQGPLDIPEALWQP